MNPLLSLVGALILQAPADVDPVANIEDLDLEAMLAQPVSVTSSAAATLRSSPGIVTVLTRDDVRALGVRDLGELLPFIAGFDLAVDTVGLVGPSFRGVWGFEGKVLVLVDGVEMNEPSFGSVPLFARVPLEDVERIEILRGPGSARYGGFAELAVVSVTTRAEAARDRFDLEATTGATTLEAPPRNGSAALAGGLTLPSLRERVGDVDVAGFAAVTTRSQSQRDYVPPGGEPALSQATRSDALNLWLQGTLRAPHLEARVLMQNWQQQNQTGFDESLAPSPGPVQFLTGIADLRFPIALSSTLSLLPRLTLSRFLPWRSQVNDPTFRLVDDRARGGVTARWRALRGLDLAGGVELTGDIERRPGGADVDGDVFVFDFEKNRDGGVDDAFYGNAAAFGEAVVDTSLFLLTVGARGERHTAYGDSFVPRVALTRVFPHAHAKLLVAGAFRSPATADLRVNPDLKPETTRSLGVEGGLELNPTLYLTVNAFDLTVNDPIVYFVDSSAGDEDGYATFGHTGSRGVEATLLDAASWGRLELSWSYAIPAGKNDVDVYAVPGDATRLLGLPTHKVVAITSLFLSDAVTLTGNCVLRSERAAVVDVDSRGRYVVDDLPPSVMLGGAVRLAVPDSGVEVVLGVRNLLDEDFRLAQPYASGHGPLPVDDREVFVRVAGALDASTPPR
jgi:outer membrane receptor protein involved in Fe transport